METHYPHRNFRELLMSWICPIKFLGFVHIAGIMKWLH